VPNYSKLHDLISHRVTIEYDTGARVTGYLASCQPSAGPVEFVVLQEAKLVDSKGRVVREAGELTLSLFTRADFDRLPPAERELYIQRLDLQEAYCRQKWDRGDTVVLAMESGKPAGILWCARTPVYVPDIGREVRPGAGECYIHDVYVHPDERGRQVAPAMLDFLARELRSRDVYRAWALIERTNVASTRAFEKAAYASVADVVYARMGLASRLFVRPPDPEARAFLGLT